MRELCKFRHDIHSNKYNLLNHDIQKQVFPEIGVFTQSKLNNKLKQAGLEEIEYFNNLYLISEKIEKELNSISKSKYEREKYSKSFIENLNEEIERYLKEIDKMYGTKFKPSKISRMIWNANADLFDKTGSKNRRKTRQKRG